ncbi:Trehalose utilisation [Mariniphaga anaerophila]|uniref:Trehalose utilisation n=1 Tax=Mariniphaga anaerophila TaxID=1484053 RepID=A0A1M4TI57_9BACT|nr:ThuA domain-containing protein [Mariniphaga anaerophila]SHE44189.1 Trehalose utilisation [Mariniphaga anaerophila]
MKTMIIAFGLFFAFAVTICAQEKKPEFETPAHLLVFSKTDGFRHESLSSGIKMLFDLSKAQNWVITATEEAAVFTPEILSTFDVVIFMNPTGDALNTYEQEAFEDFMKRGKGMVGIHAAADFEYEWPFYGELVGGYFKTHPPAQTGTVIFENFDHPAMEPFKGMKSYTTFDEWYTFRENPRSKVNVLARLDENSIKKYKNDDWRMGDHPIIWWQETNGMRTFYTGFGHTHEAFQDKKIIEHIKNAINWAAKRTD